MKLKKIKLSNFKKFQNNIEIDISTNINLFVGGNNSGKTSVLQALALWSFLKDKWILEGNTTKKYRGVQVNRLEGIPIPIKEVSYLWNNTKTSEKRGGKQNQPVHIHISLVYEKNNKEYEYGFDLRRHTSESFTFLPLENSKTLDIPSIDISYLPAFSGIKSSEEYLGSDLTVWSYIHQGLPGNVLRNILFRIFEINKKEWNELINEFENFFSLKLKEPQNLKEISVFYELGKKDIEINTLGSGSLQILLLIAFIFWGKSNVILLDEPDSHEHIFLQKEVFQWIRRIAKERNIQVIISTHSEVFVDNIDIGDENIISFYPSVPKKALQKENIKNSLKNISHMDAIFASEKKWILFLEGETDKNILVEFAEVLKIKIDWKNIWIEYATQSESGKAIKRVNILKEIESSFESLWIRDGDCSKRLNTPAGFNIKQLNKTEIENYFLQKDVIFRFLEKKYKDLYQNIENSFFPLSEDEDILQKFNNFWKSLEDITPDLSLEKGSDIIKNIFKKIENYEMPKNEFYLIAREIKKEEIDDEIKEILLLIKKFSENK